MSPIAASLTVFACVFGGVLVGMWLRSTLPKYHLDAESRDTVKVGIGLIATMTALVLGLVTAAAKSSFDSGSAAVKQAAMNTLAVDRALARYGPETGEIREGMKDLLAARIDAIWSFGLSEPSNQSPMKTGFASVEEVAEGIQLSSLTMIRKTGCPVPVLQPSKRCCRLDGSAATNQAHNISIATTMSAAPPRPASNQRCHQRCAVAGETLKATAAVLNVIPSPTAPRAHSGQQVRASRYGEPTSEPSSSVEPGKTHSLEGGPDRPSAVHNLCRRDT